MEHHVQAPPKEDASKITNDGTLLTWLGELVAIRQGLPPFYGTEDGYGNIEKGKESVDVYRGNDNAVGLHTRCWQLLDNPDFDWLVEHRIISQEGIAELSPFKECSEQFYDWECFINNDKDLWAALDPSRDERSMKRIQKRIADIEKKYGKASTGTSTTTAKAVDEAEIMGIFKQAEKLSKNLNDLQKKCKTKSKKGADVICNPITGRWVDIKGKIGRALISEYGLEALITFSNSSL